MTALAGLTARCAGTFSAPRPTLHPRHNGGPAPVRPSPTSRPQQVSLVGALPTSLPRPLPSEGGSGAGDWPVPEADPSGERGSYRRSASPDWPSSSSSSSSSSVGLKPLPRDVEGVADDVNLANPLQRMERLGTAWFGTIFELDGVCIEYECGDGGRSWQALATEEGKPAPPLWALKKARGMKNEQVVTEVFNWTRNPVEARRLAQRREAILSDLLGARKPMVPPGVTQLMDILQRNSSPLALVSSAPEQRVLPALEQAGLTSRFDAIVTADDVYRGKPDPEGYLYAAQKMQRPPLRCVVIGSSNLSIEAAHEVGMKCVALAGRQPVYELGAADLVVRDLSQLSFVNLKQLFAAEERVAGQRGADEDLEPELEEDSDGGSYVTTQVLDW